MAWAVLEICWKAIKKKKTVSGYKISKYTSLTLIIYIHRNNRCILSTVETEKSIHQLPCSIILELWKCFIKVLFVLRNVYKIKYL